MPTHIEQPESAQVRPASMNHRMQPLRLGLPLHRARTGRHQPRHARFAPAQNGSGGAQILDPGIGARTDEDTIHGDMLVSDLAGRQPPYRRRESADLRRPGSGQGRSAPIGQRCPVTGQGFIRAGSPGDRTARWRSASSKRDVAIKQGARHRCSAPASPEMAASSACTLRCEAVYPRSHREGFVIRSRPGRSARPPRSTCCTR